MSYLKEKSRNYQNVLGVNKIAQGGEAIVYRVEHTGLDEIVAKCTIFNSESSPTIIKNAYNAIFYES